MSAADPFVVARRCLRCSLLVLVTLKLTYARGLPWYTVAAPLWLPVVAAVVLPLFPAYRRWFARRTTQRSPAADVGR